MKQMEEGSQKAMKSVLPSSGAVEAAKDAAQDDGDTDLGESSDPEGEPKELDEVAKCHRAAVLSIWQAMKQKAAQAKEMSPASKAIAAVEAQERGAENEVLEKAKEIQTANAKSNQNAEEVRAVKLVRKLDEQRKEAEEEKKKVTAKEKAEAAKSTGQLVEKVLNAKAEQKKKKKKATPNVKPNPTAQ